ncbi:hypothetical protein ACQJBY_059246 [Aegilops geniculata]
MVSRDVMEALGKDEVLVNVGRGGLVDEPELVRCLHEDVIGGAGLDVYENEPAVLPELLAMDNVVLSDHRAVLTTESIGGVLEVVSPVQLQAQELLQLHMDISDWKQTKIYFR